MEILEGIGTPTRVSGSDSVPYVNSRRADSEAAAAGDAAVRRELDGVAADVKAEKARVDEKFNSVATQVELLRREQERTNQKLDRLIELQQGRR